MPASHAIHDPAQGTAAVDSPRTDTDGRQRRQRIDRLLPRNDDQGRRARFDPSTVPPTDSRPRAAIPRTGVARETAAITSASAPASPSPMSPVPAFRRAALTPGASPLAAPAPRDGARQVYPKWKGSDRMIVSSDRDSTAKNSARAQRNYRKVPSDNVLNLATLTAHEPDAGGSGAARWHG